MRSVASLYAQRAPARDHGGRAPRQGRLQRRPGALHAGARGFSLLETLIALVILAIGILAVSQVFPAGSRVQTKDRMNNSAGYFAREKIEALSSVPWDDPTMSIGRHPSGTGLETVGAIGSFHRYYTVDTLPPPLSSLKTITVKVIWTATGPCTLSASSYHPS